MADLDDFDAPPLEDEERQQLLATMRGGLSSVAGTAPGGTPPFLDGPAYDAPPVTAGGITARPATGAGDYPPVTPSGSAPTRGIAAGRSNSDLENAEELPASLARRSVTGMAPAVVAAPAPAVGRQRSLTGMGPADAPSPVSITGTRSFVDTPASGVLDAPPETQASLPGESAFGEQRPDLPGDVLAGRVAAPEWKDYRPQHVSLGRKILAGVMGGLSGMKDPRLGAQVARSIAYGPQERRFADDTTEYKDVLGQGEQREKTQDDEARRDLESAQAGRLRKELDADKPKPKEEEWSVMPGWQGPNGEPVQQEKNSGQTRLVSLRGVKPRTTALTKPDTIEMGNGTYQWDPNGSKWNKIGPAKKVDGNEGTWTLEEDADGKPVLYNSKTAETRPANGIQKSGTKAKADAASEKATAPAQAALDYANDYLANKTFTGAGDEALQEKYFELAKPSVGFRMTQPQIDMLQKSRSWMGSLEAHIRHATTGTWFSDDQRKQIVDTMSDLAASKIDALKSGTAGRSAPAAGGGDKTYTDAELQAAAKAHGMTPAQAEKAYKDKGYKKASH